MPTSLLQHDRSVLLANFESFRADIDDYNDRRERLIKASRDITNLSKKIIFLLHRIALEDDEASNARAAKRGISKLREVQDIYAGLAPELIGDHFWRYQRQVSPGLQEYIEALSFAHYLQHGTLIPFETVQRSLSSPEGVPFFPLTVSDYLLGLSDLTGELMRFAISGLSSHKGGRAKATQVCAFVRACKADFEQYSAFVPDLRKKQAVTAQSLEKIEDAAYTIAVRSSEYDLPPEILDDIVAQSISHFSDRSHKRTRGHDLEDDPDNDGS
ncbi:Translin [Macrolepiota fuliginosa MF-IS2]|uniref:Translin n=1 Tax=Macrolepiota fuliginosa MF-IS2 TaxID=1400762 RepID=A0A9P5XJG9_9AGAR|nr:Translin [Macrolepiota fuliginosa MF-IS2]